MPDSGPGSITRLIGDLKGGDAAAAQGLWERYFARMVELARARLRASSRKDAASDEEDAALSAFDSLCAGLAHGRFPQLSDRDDLWRLLVVITSRKVMAAARRQFRQKRGDGQVRLAADLPDPGSDGEDDILARAVGSEPTPEFAAMVAEEFRLLLERLGDETLRKVAILRMEGETTDAIAAKLGCARRTVARQLALIRRILDPESA
jgi:DNA-directed RNA polymerase specialized sigma24 family protein